MTVASREFSRFPPVGPQWWTHPEGPPFVGRAEEMLALDGAWRSARAGRRQVLFVLGEAGAGKSRLAAEMTVRCADQGAAVLVGWCLPDAPVAYEPFRSPLVTLMEDLLGDDPIQRWDAARELLVAPTQGDNEGPHAEARRARAPEAFEAVATALRSASSTCPIILVVEDLHWATPSSIDLLSWIVRRTPEANLMILVTARNTGPEYSDEVRGTLSELYRQPGVSALELAGLPTAEIARLVTTEAGIDPTRAPEMADRLLVLTAGNPFLLQEICRDLRRRTHASEPLGTALHVPESVRAVFASRIRRLTQEERWVIERAALLGDRFPTSMLEAVTESAIETMPALDHAVDLGLLVPLPDEQGFGFPHALARQAVLDLTPPARLAAGHGRVADLLEARSGLTLPEVQLLAHHNLNAFGRVEKARTYLIRAAELADRSWAYTEAAQHYERAAELSQTANERHRLLLCAVDCLQSSGEYRAAREVADRVAGEAVDAGMRLDAAILGEQEATLDGGDLRAVRLLAEALEELPTDVHDRRCLRGLVGLSRGLGQVLDSPDAAPLYEVVVAGARHTGDTRLIADVLSCGLALAFGRPGRSDEALVAARELTTLARPGDAQNLGTSGFFRCLLGLRTGRIDDVHAGLVDYQLAFDIGGHLWFAYWPDVVDFDLRFMRGDFSGAAQVADRIMSWGIERFGDDHNAHYGVHMFQVQRERGALEEVRGLITGDEPAQGSWAPALLALYTELRMARPARRLLDLLGDDEVLRANRLTEYMPTALAYLVEGALFLDDEVTLRRLRPMVAEHSGLNLVSDQFVALNGAADRYLGMIDAALGEVDPLPAFEAAAELASRCGFIVDRALTLTARARHLARIHGPGAREVIDTAAEARAIAEPIGQHRVLRALPAATGRAPGPARHPECRLTERELEVLRLVCMGCSNREIAQRLVISQNTAANHVRAILTKTDSANRTEAAMLAVSRGWIASA